MSAAGDRSDTDRDSPAAGESQRLERWLWHARVLRTRSAAADLVSAGHVRVNGQRALAPARQVRVGDVLTIALDRRVLVLRVLGFAERRGAYSDARLLYEDLTSARGG